MADNTFDKNKKKTYSYALKQKRRTLYFLPLYLNIKKYIRT